MSTEKTAYTGRVHLVDKYAEPYQSKEGLRQAYAVSFKDTKGENQQGGMMVGMPNEYPVQPGKLYSYTVHKNSKNSDVVTITARPADEVLPVVEEAIGNISSGNPATQESVKPEVPKNMTNIPDTQPRKGVVQVMHSDDPWVRKDGPTLYKTRVYFEDGAAGIMWSEKSGHPLEVGQEINYTFDKIYAENWKRIAILPEGSNTDKETMIMRMGCNNTALAFMGLDQTKKWTIEEMFAISEQIQTNVLRSK
ncbi:MAG TPA: hypothetical protein PLZ24_16820 [Flavobacteriales bacterium]|nr:hypothetical protein [Flavobacteriales bacterium]